MDSRKILVASGDYELIYQSRQALTDLGYTFMGAYSHHDSVHVAKNAQYDAFLVNMALRDRESGEFTARHLRQHYPDTPLILYTPEEVQASINGHAVASDYNLYSLDDAAIRQTVLQALHHFTAPLRTTQTMHLRGRDDAEYWAVEEVQILLALTRSLTEVLDVNEVLNRVVDAARELTSADEAMILLPDGATNELYLRARVGMDEANARNFRMKADDGSAGQVFQTGLPLSVGARGPLKLKTEYFVNALLYVPILLKGQTIGVLGVNNVRRQDVFNSHHEALLLNLAAYAAIAIENARIHGQSVQRARELKALVDASQAINASLSLDRTLPTICEQLVRALSVNHAEVYQWSREENVLRPLARFYQTIWRPGSEPTLLINQYPLIRAALREQRPRLVRAERTDSVPERAYLHRAGAAAMLVLPIPGDYHPFGALLAFYAHPPRFVPSAETCQTLQFMALDLLVEHIDKGRKLTQRLLNIAAQINELCGSDWCEFSSTVPGTDALTCHLALGKVAWAQAPTAIVNMNDYSDLVEVLETQNLINQHLEGDTLTAGVHALLELTRGQALLGLPLVYRGQTQGIVLCVDSESSRVFPEREIELARAVVGQAASALENARLLHDLEESLVQLEHAQSRLIQAERLSAMGELAAAVAHQVNNPLTTIVADAQLLMEKTQRDTFQYETLNAIYRSGKRASAVSRRLLAAVRPQGNEETPPRLIQIIPTIEDTLSLVKSHIERDGIRIVMHLPAELPPVLVVPGELEDVWLNLVLNAHDALVGRPNPVITVYAEYDHDADVNMVTVTDNGPGIPETILTDIFKPFFTTKPVGEGTGLGLHICRQVMQRAGGQIFVESAPEHGARFVITLPVQKGG
jgi:signal transduction histidine kinase/CheY-like chemotaxis protein